ncbi:MAG: anti-sigma factor family protein [Phycisphaerales bacterium]
MNAVDEYISCRELIDFISDYLEGSLNESQRAEFDRHLSVCPPCVRYLDAFRTTVMLAKGAGAASEPRPLNPVPPALRDAIREARRQQR